VSALRLARLGAALAVAATLLVGGAASARPLYFDNLTALYGFTEGDDLHACGVCHRRWDGTGARNPYGNSVEQQLYLGKTILDSLMDVEGDDTDLDGFTNGEELATFATLPGYSCDNYLLAIDPPPNFQSLITPAVASCLEPQDILVAPTQFSFITEVGEEATETVELINNGTDFPIEVTQVAFEGAADPSLDFVAPATPLSLGVGERVDVVLTHRPTRSASLAATLRIASDDPDEPIVDVTLTALSFVPLLASPDDREACQGEISKQMERYTKAHARALRTCFLDELRGRACRRGHLDADLAKAEARLRSAVGGERDKHCAGNGLTPALLGMPDTCADPCGQVELRSIRDLADCLVCQQGEASSALVEATTGARPPDGPATVLGSRVWKCSRKVQIGAEKSLRKMQKSLQACELDNVTANAPIDCGLELGGELQAASDAVDERFLACSDTTGMQACANDPEADPDCLGAATRTQAERLVDAVFADD
jgi:hypothetical protein